MSLRGRVLACWLVAALITPASAFAEPLRVLVVGDSLSAAYGLSVSDGWVALLEARLADWAAARDLPAPAVVNASVSGDTTGGGRTRLPRALDLHRPDVVVIALGGNDGLRGQPVIASGANLDAMVRGAVEARARVVMLGVRMPPNYGPAYTEAFAAMFESVAQRYGVGLVPRFLEGVALVPDLMQQDGIHPTADAQGRMLDNAWPPIEAALEALQGGSG